VPVVVLLIAWSVGVSTTGAITAGLVTNALLLVALGWIASAQSHRSVPARAASAALAGAFGMVMIAIKTILH
jgi:predicted benzoate:H+ symporter BenE